MQSPNLLRQQKGCNPSCLRTGGRQQENRATHREPWPRRRRQHQHDTPPPCPFLPSPLSPPPPPHPIPQVLSTRHQWDVGRGHEIAIYCNTLRPGSFTLSTPEVQELAQGSLEVARVHCASCRSVIGWKFCELAEHPTDFRNLHQVGARIVTAVMCVTQSVL